MPKAANLYLSIFSFRFHIPQPEPSHYAFWLFGDFGASDCQTDYRDFGIKNYLRTEVNYEKTDCDSRGCGGERKKGWGAEGAEEAEEAGGEERTYNFWTQSSRNATQNFTSPGVRNVG